MAIKITPNQNQTVTGQAQLQDLNQRLVQVVMAQGVNRLPNAELISFVAEKFNLYNQDPQSPYQLSVPVKEKLLQLASATPNTFYSNNYLDFSKFESVDFAHFHVILNRYHQEFELKFKPYNQTIGAFLPILRNYMIYLCQTDAEKSRGFVSWLRYPPTDPVLGKFSSDMKKAYDETVRKATEARDAKLEEYKQQSAANSIQQQARILSPNPMPSQVSSEQDKKTIEDLKKQLELAKQEIAQLKNARVVNHAPVINQPSQTLSSDDRFKFLHTIEDLNRQLLESQRQAALSEEQNQGLERQIGKLLTERGQYFNQAQSLQKQLNELNKSRENS